MAGNVPIRHTKSVTDLTRGTFKRGYKRVGTDARLKIKIAMSNDIKEQRQRSNYASVKRHLDKWLRVRSASRRESWVASDVLV
jgi:hypothetical protein